MITWLRKQLVAGLLIILPIWATFATIRMLFELFDQLIDRLPQAYQPEALLGFDIPGLSGLLIILLLVLVGMLGTNFIGGYVVKGYEWVLNRIPLVRSIYSSVKQAADVMFTQSDQSFSRVVMVEFPRPGMHSLAFVTCSQVNHLSSALPEDSLMLFVPTTPIPTSGYSIMMPQKDIVFLDMSVEDAMKIILSMGTVVAEKSAALQQLKSKHQISADSADV